MKKTLLVVMALMFAISANAQLLLEENFSYSTGQLTAVNAGANVSGGNWVNFSGTTNVLNVTSGSLSYSGYLSSDVGNKISTINGSAEDAYRQFATQTGEVYASFLINITSTTGMAANISTTGDYSIAFLPSTSITALNARVSVRLGTVADTYNFGLRASSGNSASVFAPTDYSIGVTHLIVLKYDVSSNHVSMWIDPDLSGEEPTTDLEQTAATALTEVARFAVRQGTNSVNASIDGIRVATTWSLAPLPVELTSFTAIAKGRGVELAWKTATELNNVGFEVEKNVGGTWNKIGFVEGNGTTNAPKSYTFVDASAKGNVSYRLKQIDRDGKFEYSPTVEANVALTAEDFSLTQNYPNPFNPSTTFSFAVKNAEHVNVTVYNSLGQVVATLFNNIANPNELYSLNFDGKNLSSGTYFARLTSNSKTQLIKMTLMK